MAIVVEDGTGLEDANAYASKAEADAYFTDRVVTTWTGTDPAKEAALIKATDYIDGRFGGRFYGDPQFPDTPQALAFPRMGYDRDGVALDDLIPTVLKRACFEYALRALSGTPLAPDPTPQDGAVMSKRTKVGPIETSVQYSAQVNGTLRAYPAADMLLRPLIRTGGGTIR